MTGKLNHPTVVQSAHKMSTKLLINILQQLALKILQRVWIYYANANWYKYWKEALNYLTAKPSLYCKKEKENNLE